MLLVPVQIAAVCGGWQTDVGLGKRFKAAAWKWAAVLGQVEVYGWQKLNMRCSPLALSYLRWQLNPEREKGV
jgi:hypothetical protein